MIKNPYLADNVRLRRLELRLSQQELAARASVSQGYLSCIERGQWCERACLARLAEALGVEESVLLRRVRRRVMATAA